MTEGLIVTRHFTGLWDQVDQESQGIALQVIEQLDDSRRSVAYWYTYDADRKTAWFIGIGDLIENRIELELYDSTDVGFMQPARPGNDSVHNIGTMTITFGSCQSGTVAFETSHELIGSGSFRIERLADIMNTRCTGGISDDMHADSMFGQQRIELTPAREGGTGSGHARYEDYPGHMELQVEVEGLPDGEYDLYVGMQHRGDFAVLNGRGEMVFASPAEDGKMMLNFDPRGMRYDIYDSEGVVLSSFDNRFDPGLSSQEGDMDHGYACESGQGGGMGGGLGMMDCVADDGESVEIKASLENTGILSDARGEARWDMNTHRVEFSVEIEDVPAGAYTLSVGAQEVGVIDAFAMHGEVYGRIHFRDPEVYGREPLDFEPRGQKLEVLRAGSVILEVEFPRQAQ
jgi:hypothetical protein